MWHIVAHTADRRLLFRTWSEGLEAWQVVVRAVPGIHGLCLMPNHLHVLCDTDRRAQLGRALGGLARRRNAREGLRGRLFLRLPRAQWVEGRKKQRRVLRYIHLNPCRARLTQDPLAWPLSTHRDALGLVGPRVGPLQGGERFHRYVSSDPTTCPLGTPLPVTSATAQGPDEILAAVSCVLRLPIQLVGRHPVGRSLAMRTFDELYPLSQRAAAPWLGVARSTLARLLPVAHEQLAMVCRVAGDERFPGLDDTPLPLA